MRIGWVGLGKLGLPCALQLAAWGHEVAGYDVNADLMDRLESGRLPEKYVEPGVAELHQEILAATAVWFKTARTVAEVVERSDVVFVAVQTPHAPAYDGTTPVPAETRDFEYGYLVQAVRDLSLAAVELNKAITIVVVSTVMPGTTDRLLRHLVFPPSALVYSPQFIAMGTVLDDFRNPEFILIGGGDGAARGQVMEVFKHAKGMRFATAHYADAELIKVAYNTFISMKIVWANHLAAICDAVGADADTIVSCLALADRRLLSTAYMRPGMGDGGACHPRDLIALADLEVRANLPIGFYGWLARLRDEQTRALANLVVRWHEQTSLDPRILGLTYKPNVPLTDGSPGLLLQHMLRTTPPFDKDPRRVRAYDPHRSADYVRPFDNQAVFVIATDHPGFHDGKVYPRGSVVIDPWGHVRLQPDSGVTLVRPGRR